MLGVPLSWVASRCCAAMFVGAPGRECARSGDVGLTVHAVFQFIGSLFEVCLPCDGCMHVRPCRSVLLAGVAFAVELAVAALAGAICAV